MSLDLNLQSAFTAVGNAVKGKISVSEKGIANGLATLDSGGKVPSSQLPAYVDDVVEYANLAAFPVTGESGIIYIALDNNTQYRWSGSTYQSITSGAVSSVAGKTGNVTLDIADITSLQTALDAKANTSHSHSIADITNLQTTLDAKATTSSLDTLSNNVGLTDTNYVTVFNAALV